MRVILALSAFLSDSRLSAGVIEIRGRARVFLLGNLEAGLFLGIGKLEQFPQREEKKKRKLNEIVRESDL